MQMGESSLGHCMAMRGNLSLEGLDSTQMTLFCANSEISAENEYHNTCSPFVLIST